MEDSSCCDEEYGYNIYPEYTELWDTVTGEVLWISNTTYIYTAYEDKVRLLRLVDVARKEQTS